MLENHVSSHDEMTLLFIHTCPSLVAKKLTKTQERILYKILTEYVSNKNICILDPMAKGMIADALDIRKITVDHYIRAFVKNRILLKEEGGYSLNREIFGKKDWVEKSIIVYSEETIFDFEKLEVRKNEPAVKNK